MEKLNRWGPMTVLMVLVVTIVVLAGAVVSIVNPDTLSFEEYLDTLVKAAGAIAALGIGRGVLEGMKHNAQAKTAEAAVKMAEGNGGAQVRVDAPGANVEIGQNDAGEDGADLPPGLLKEASGEEDPAIDEVADEALPSDEDEAAAPPPGP